MARHRRDAINHRGKGGIGVAPLLSALPLLMSSTGGSVAGNLVNKAGETAITAAEAFSLSDLATAIKTQAENMMNSSAFSTDSLEGWICIMLVCFIVWNIGKRIMKFVSWSICVIFLFQVMHWLYTTQLGTIWPWMSFFKMDVLDSIAQCFVGSRVCDFLLTVNGWMKAIVIGAYAMISGSGLLPAAQRFLGDLEAGMPVAP